MHPKMGALVQVRFAQHNCTAPLGDGLNVRIHNQRAGFMAGTGLHL